MPVLPKIDSSRAPSAAQRPESNEPLESFLEESEEEDEGESSSVTPVTSSTKGIPVEASNINAENTTCKRVSLTTDNHVKKSYKLLRIINAYLERKRSSVFRQSSLLSMSSSGLLQNVNQKKSYND